MIKYLGIRLKPQNNIALTYDSLTKQYIEGVLKDSVLMKAVEPGRLINLFLIQS